MRILLLDFRDSLYLIGSNIGLLSFKKKYNSSYHSNADTQINFIMHYMNFCFFYSVEIKTKNPHATENICTLSAIISTVIVTIISDIAYRALICLLSTRFSQKQSDNICLGTPKAFIKEDRDEKDPSLLENGSQDSCPIQGFKYNQEERRTAPQRNDDGICADDETSINTVKKNDSDTLLGIESLSETDVKVVRLVFDPHGLQRYSYHRSMVDRLQRSWQHVDSDADEALLLNERTPPCGEIAVSRYDDELSKLLSDEPPVEEPKQISLDTGVVILLFHICTYIRKNVVTPRQIGQLGIVSVVKSLFQRNLVWREKGRDLTQSYEKSPYTHRQIQNAT